MDGGQLEKHCMVKNKREKMFLMAVKHTTAPRHHSSKSWTKLSRVSHTAETLHSHSLGNKLHQTKKTKKKTMTTKKKKKKRERKRKRKKTKKMH